MRTVGFWILAIGALGVAGYALMAYAAYPVGQMVHPKMRAVFEEHRLGIYVHIFASTLTLLLGPWQFVSRLRKAWPKGHRWLGRIYLGLGVLPGGLAGLYMSLYSFGGAVSHSGFAILAALWLWTGAMAYSTARARRFAEHRRWMIRNFSLSLAAVTLRAMLGAGFASGLRFEAFYPWLAWLCWLPNLVVAEWMLRQERGGATPGDRDRGTGRV